MATKLPTLVVVCSVALKKTGSALLVTTSSNGPDRPRLAEATREATSPSRTCLRRSHCSLRSGVFLHLHLFKCMEVLRTLILSADTVVWGRTSSGCSVLFDVPTGRNHPQVHAHGCMHVWQKTTLDPQYGCFSVVSWLGLTPSPRRNVTRYCNMNTILVPYRVQS